MPPPFPSADSAAGIVARFLGARGVDRIFAPCGGHIMPPWMRADAEGIRIVDVRDERAAVHMAHAHAEPTSGLGVALVTAGPGVTNAMTGIANAHVARAPVLVRSGTLRVPRRTGARCRIRRFRPKGPSLLLPDPDDVRVAVELLWSARRPVVVGGPSASTPSSSTPPCATARRS